MLKGNSIFQTLNFSSASGTLVSSDTLVIHGRGSSAAAISGFDVYDSGSYLITTGAGVSAGAVTVQLLQDSATSQQIWVTATTPNSATGAAFTLVAALGASTVYNGSLGVTGGVFFPCSGIRLAISGLTGGSIVQAQLILTKR